MVVWELLDVLGVVQVDIAFRLDESWVVLPETFEALASRCCNVSLPMSSLQASWAGLHGDPTVYDRDEACVGDQIQNRARPGSVDAREQDIAVQGRAVSAFLNHSVLQSLDHRDCSSRAELQLPPRHD